MFDQGPHVVLRRDGVCVVLKTPDFGISGDETSLAQLDAMTLKVTPLRPMQTVILEFEAL